MVNVASLRVVVPFSSEFPLVRRSSRRGLYLRLGLRADGIGCRCRPSSDLILGSRASARRQPLPDRARAGPRRFACTSFASSSASHSSVPRARWRLVKGEPVRRRARLSGGSAGSGDTPSRSSDGAAGEPIHCRLFLRRGIASRPAGGIAGPRRRHSCRFGDGCGKKQGVTCEIQSGEQRSRRHITGPFVVIVAVDKGHSQYYSNSVLER